MYSYDYLIKKSVPKTQKSDFIGLQHIENQGINLYIFLHKNLSEGTQLINLQFFLMKYSNLFFS